MFSSFPYSETNKPLNDVTKETWCFAQSTAYKKNCMYLVFMIRAMGRNEKLWPVWTEIIKTFHLQHVIMFSGSLFLRQGIYLLIVQSFLYSKEWLKDNDEVWVCVCVEGNTEFTLSSPILPNFPWISNKLVVAITPSGFQMLTMWLSRNVLWLER